MSLSLPADEMLGLSQLIQLQKQKIITIKPCDKGAGIIILDYEKYMQSCYKHLQSTQKQEDGTALPYYSKVETEELDQIKQKISELLEEGIDNEYISKEEYGAMDPQERGAA